MNIIFYLQEVFRSEVRSTAMLSEVVGKCWVMTVKGKEYFNYAPEGYADDDVYVCEYRYSSRGRCFTKLKSWAFGSDRVKLIPRVKALEPIRIASVFRERVEKHKEELQQMEDDMEKGPAEDYPVSLAYFRIPITNYKCFGTNTSLPHRTLSCQKFQEKMIFDTLSNSILHADPLDLEILFMSGLKMPRN